MHLLEEIEVVAEKVETQKEFLELHASFFSSCELTPDQLDVDLNNIALMTSAEPHTMSLVGVVFKHPLLKYFLHINGGQIPKVSSKWSLHCPVYCISDYLVNCFAHLIGNIEILQVIAYVVPTSLCGTYCDGSAMLCRGWEVVIKRCVDVVVNLLRFVAVDVGSGESDCIDVRLITRVVIGGTEEVS
ncbi:hypothetical protein Tco_0379561 [Tanacetum coccineum]